MSASAPSFWRRLYYTRAIDAFRGRLDASLDWRLVIERAGLPSKLAEVVQEVAGRTKLWMGEKSDVAAELAAHFQDGLDAGHTPEELVNSFGDPRQAARLIRRSKRRGRSFWWQAWMWGWRAAGALFAFYILSGLYVLWSKPSIKTDYLAILNEKALAVLEDQRAWPLYREALTKYDSSSIPDSDPHPRYTKIPKPGDAAWPEMVAWLNNHADALALIREAARMPELGFPVYTSDESFSREDRYALYDLKDPTGEDDSQEPESPALEDRLLWATRLPHLQSFRSFAWLLDADTHRAAEAGDGGTALANVRTMLGISRHCEETPFLVNLLVGVAVQKRAFQVVQKQLAEIPTLWSDDQLRDLAHAIASSELSWDGAVEAEKLWFYDVIQRIYTDDGHGDGHMTGEGMRMIGELVSDNRWRPDYSLPETERVAQNVVLTAVAPVMLYTFPSRREMTDEYERLMDQSAADVQQPLWQWPTDTVEDEVLNWPKTKKLRYFLIDLVLPGMEPASRAAESYRGTRDGTLVGIALELYHRQQGQWPTSLDQLSPGYLPTLPVDRITGEPLHYEVVNDRPLVWSVGVDLDNDAGRVPIDWASDELPDVDYATPVIGRPGQRNKGGFGDGDWVLWTTDAYVGNWPDEEVE